MVLKYGYQNKFNFEVKHDAFHVDDGHSEHDHHLPIRLVCFSKYTYLPWCCSHPLHHHKAVRAESLACKDVRVMTPIGVSINLFNVLDKNILCTLQSSGKGKSALDM